MQYCFIDGFGFPDAWTNIERTQVMWHFIVGGFDSGRDCSNYLQLERRSIPYLIKKALSELQLGEVQSAYLNAPTLNK